MTQSKEKSPPSLSIQDLTVTLPNGRRLFHRATLEIKAGELVLLAGHSGSGKSTLLALIANLADDPARLKPSEGTINIPSTGALRSPVGVVFQNHALFSEFSAADNVQFALDHGCQPTPAMRADQLLAKLAVPLNTPLCDLSGGERQRVALARALAHDAPLILFDEPTTGLDPARARDIADLIAATHKRSDKTIIIVTHDFAPFLRHKPRLVLIDEAHGKLVDVDESGLDAHFNAPTEPLKSKREPANAPTNKRLTWLESPGEVVWLMITALSAALGGWRHYRWKLRYLWHYGRTVAVGTTAAYVAIAGAMLGFVFTSFSFSQLPYNEVTLPLLTEEFLAATGYTTFRVVVPLLTSVLLAGQCGAAIAADIGTRRLTHQFEAAASLGANPRHYWYGNIALTLVVSGPLLVALAFLVNWAAALLAFLVSHETATVNVFLRNFMVTAWPEHHALPIGTGWVAAKGALGGLIIGAVAYALGARPKSSPTDISQAVGRTIFWASLAVLAFHSTVSFIEF